MRERVDRDRDVPGEDERHEVSPHQCGGAAAAGAALVRLGNVDFAGARARDAATLAGSFDDLTQSASELAVEIGKASGVIDGLTQTVKLLTLLSSLASDGARRTNDLAKEYGALGNALLALTNLAGGRFGAALGNVRGIVEGGAPTGPASQVSAGGNVGLGASSADGRLQITQNQQTSQSVAALVAELNKQADAYGKTRIQSLELARAQALGKAANDAERAAINASYDALINVVRAQDASAKGADAKAKAEATAKAATEAHTRAMAAQQSALRSLLDGIYNINPAVAEYRDQVTELVALFQAGAIGQEEFAQALAQAQSNLADATGPESITGSPDDYADTAQEQVDAFGNVWEDGVDQLSGSLRGIFRDLFGAAGDDGAAIFEAMIRKIAYTQNLASSVTSGSQAMGRGFETSSGFVGPPTAQGGQQPAGMDTGSAIANTAASFGPAIGTAAGGGGENAALGANIGAAIGSIFGPIGTLVGGILGGLIGGAFDDTPRITVAGNRNGQESGGRSAFGSFGASTDSIDLRVSEVITAVRQVDNAIASLLTSTERAAVTGALANFRGQSSGDDASVEEILRRRVGVIIQTVEPAFASFLNAIDDVSERVRQFEALRTIRKQIEDIDNLVAESFGTPIEAQTARFDRMQQSVSEAADAFGAAIDAQDFALAAEAADALQTATIQLAQAQIDAAINLESALAQLDAQSRAFAVNLAQRIASLSGGDLTGVIGVINTNLQTTRAAVGTARTPEQSLAYLNEFIATVDAWLQQSTAQVRNLLAEQIAALDAERDAIMGAAQERANFAISAGQQALQAQSDYNQTLIAALQEQLALAQDWQGVLDSTGDIIDRLRFGSANPVGLQSQFANLGSEADSLFAQFNTTTGRDRVDIANRLLEILQQQQQVGSSLFDRPSDQSVALYNEVLARINAVRGVAEPEAARAAALQQQIADLQSQTVSAVNTLTDATYFLTAEERARLDEIEEERAAAQEAAQDALDEINEQALEYYTWARTRGIELQQQQRDLLQQQLDTLTGGLDVQTFIATKQAEARDALYDIRDDLRTFLDAIMVTGAVINPGGGGGPGGPGEGGGPGGGSSGSGGATGGITVAVGDVYVTTGSGDPQAIGAAVMAALDDNLSVVASKIKRALVTA